MPREGHPSISLWTINIDQCPVCKSDRYLNPELRLLVSSCHHKMCESCIDRLYTLGPALCPICGKTLEKMAFIPQTFEDLVVEKEVAIRRKLAKEEDFPDLRSYNDYLQEVEDISRSHLVLLLSLPFDDVLRLDVEVGNTVAMQKCDTLYQLLTEIHNLAAKQPECEFKIQGSGFGEKNERLHIKCERPKGMYGELIRWRCGESGAR